MATLQNLREQRKAHALKMQALVNDHPDNEAWTTQHQEKYNNLKDTIQNIDAQIERIEHVNNVNANTSVKKRAQQENISEDEAEHKNTLDKKAFTAWARGGASALNEHEMKLLNQRMTDPSNALSTGTGSEGGFLTKKEFAPQLIQAMKAFGGMRQLAKTITTSTGTEMSFPTANAADEMGEIVGESQNHDDEDTSFGTLDLSTYKFSSKAIAVPFELLQDSEIDIEAYIRDLLALRLGRITELYFTKGDGSGKPQGLMTAAPVGRVAGSGRVDTITHDDLVELKHSVDPIYRANGSFMMHDSVLRELEKLKDNTGRPLWLPGMTSEEPSTIMNVPYAINQSMDEMGANNKPLSFGDHSKYLIRDVMQVMLFRMTDSVYTKKGQVGFLAMMRSGGRLLDVGGAVKTFQNAAS